MHTQTMGVATKKVLGYQANTNKFLRWILAILFIFLSSFSRPPSTSYDCGKEQNEPLQSSRQHRLSPVHVAFGLSGNHSGFLSEFKVALKSVLLNAPLQRKLLVHVLADQDAFHSLDEIFNGTELRTWVTRNPIEIHTYDVTPDLPILERQIEDTFKTMDSNFKLWHATGAHTIGCFFRLMAHRIIPATVEHLLYIDTDVVIMTNLEELWRQVETRPKALFHWGIGMCSGFVVMNVRRMDEIWTLAKGSPMKSIAEKYKQNINDQLVYMAVNVSYPNEVNVLSDGWDMTVTLRWPSNHLPYEEKYPNVGMLHFNGGGSDKGAYFNLTDDGGGFIKSHPNTWGQAKRYITTPWSWARYQAKSMVRSGSEGHLIKVCSWGPASGLNRSLLDSNTGGGC